MPSSPIGLWLRHLAIAQEIAPAKYPEQEEAKPYPLRMALSHVLLTRTRSSHPLDAGLRYARSLLMTIVTFFLEQRYIYNTKRISARARTRIKNSLVRNIVWCFSYAVWCISWYVPVLAFYSLAAMQSACHASGIVWDATTRFVILASRGSCLARGPV